MVNLRQGPPVPELEGDFLVKVANSRKGYRTAFEKLLGDQSFREALGRDAFRHAQEQWSPGKTEAVYVDVYRRYSKSPGAAY